jgi:hypothetical protein
VSLLVVLVGMMLSFSPSAPAQDAVPAFELPAVDLPAVDLPSVGVVRGADAPVREPEAARRTPPARFPAGATLTGAWCAEIRSGALLRRMLQWN